MKRQGYQTVFLRTDKWGLVVMLTALAHLQAMGQPPPGWWASRHVLNGGVKNDFAAINEGQLQWLATNAYAELEERLPGGAGEALRALVPHFSSTNNYSAVTAGQLKQLARFFYDRLIAEGWIDRYPWTASAADDADFSIVNIGQVKNVFSFDLVVPGSDTDKDWLSDEWEEAQFDDLSQRGNLDSDGDGRCNRAEQAFGTDPLLADSDGDGVPDGWDSNSLSAADCDGDGLPDDWERFGLGTLAYGAADDPDGDGSNNFEEFLQGTDPGRVNVSRGGLNLRVFRPLP